MKHHFVRYPPPPPKIPRTTPLKLAHKKQPDCYQSQLTNGHLRAIHSTFVRYLFKLCHKTTEANEENQTFKFISFDFFGADSRNNRPKKFGNFRKNIHKISFKKKKSH